MYPDTTTTPIFRTIETYNRKQEKLKKAKKEIAESKRLKKEVEHYYCRTGVPRDIHTIPVTD